MLKVISLLLVAIVAVSAQEVNPEVQVPCEGRSEWCMNTSNCHGESVKDLCPHGNHFQCCVPAEATPYMRITLIKARVKNVDGNVGLTPYDPETDDFADWTVLKGASDPQVVISVGNKSDKLSKRKSESKSNTLTPTYMEQYAFGRQGADAEMQWQIYDKNTNLLDGLDQLGKKKLIAEGQVNLGKFRGTDQVHTFRANSDPSQAITIRISWSSKTGKGCPEGAEHPGLFSKDKGVCECKEKYHYLGESGQCEPYPEFIQTCRTMGKKYCKSKSDRHRKLRCQDYSFSSIDKKCPQGLDGHCYFFRCKARS